MTCFLKEYLSRQLQDVVRERYEDHEDAGGYQDQTITEIAVARLGGVPVRVTTTHELRFGPRSRTRPPKVSIVPISSEEYLQVCQSGEALDLDRLAREQAERDELEKERANKRKQEEARERKRIWEAREAIVPRCPYHKVRMQERNGRRGDFWGCPRYPECRYTEDFTDEQRAALAALKATTISNITCPASTSRTPADLPFACAFPGRGSC
jgi:hypothetical protein